MSRRKAATKEEMEDTVEPRRSGRKRTVKDYGESAEANGEPAEKYGKESQPSKKVGKGKGRGKKEAAQEDVTVKVEMEEEQEEEIEEKPKPQKAKRGSAKKVTVKEEIAEEPKPQKPKKGRSKKVAVKEEIEEESVASSSNSKSAVKIKEEEGNAPVKKPGGSKTKGKKKKQGGEGEEEKENSDTNNVPKQKSGVKTGVERVLVVKGRAAVDALCPIAATSHVLEEDDDDFGECIWDCMLNQTNIEFNNNKYYLIQLLECDSSKTYSVWMRWGRVGANGQNALHPCGSNLEKAKNIFTKKFADKTKNEWDERICFEKVKGKYDLLAMDYSRGKDETDAVKAQEAKELVKKLECQLEARIKSLIELICNIRLMEEAVVEMKYDAKKAPLGKLTTDQIKAGYLALRSIDDLIQEGKYKNMQLVNACNDFYTRIPHYFGMKVPPLIRSKTEVQEKMALLEALGDIQAALSVMDQPIGLNVHPVDHHYSGLKCNMTALERDSHDFKVVESYLKSNHAKTHSQYKLELLDLFSCRKDMEYDRFKDVGNRMLLWHGSRLSNWAGILSQGLRIAPPEAPSTGYMFGKGIYFADMASKSANYCWATERSNVGLLLLSEVSLGKTNDLLAADYNANKMPKGCHSVKGCGKFVPKPETFTKLSDGVVVPVGQPLDSGTKDSQGYSLLYNEYIVYDPAQVRTRFLLKVKFRFR